eukprot:TRINITY_DN5629_c0_g1_i2.p1 TRINITY_DN5629_c0_g1~~TRINITY_DN5629_c0_g1_i2.p1  ORF type:complete len:1130 (+),score=51.26 TRINITY_DN5629_c0_g1_i2:173-3562(+)
MEKVLRQKFEEENVNYEAIIKKGRPFTDEQFPPENSSLGKKQDSEEIVKWNLVWKRPNDVFKESFDIFDGIDMHDIMQKSLGNCYFLASLSGLAEFPNRIENIFVTKSVNSAGCYALKLFVCGVPRVIVLDDYFPYLPRLKRWAFTQPNQKEIWAMLLEKVWAKIHGTYGATISGGPREALSALTGAPTVQLFHNKTGIEELWEALAEANDMNYVMVAGGAEREVNGIIRKHAYSLTKAVEVNLKGKKTEKLVQLRNPWGRHEWTGDWSDNSPLWTSELRRKLRHVSKDDGTFYMKLSDFYSIFTYSGICKCVDHYVRTSTFFYEEQACVAFELSTTVKGFFVLNGLTPRIKESMGIDGSQPPLILELYRFVNSKFVCVQNPQASDAVGVALIEAVLVPGIYIMYGRYRSGPVTAKFMNFVAYAEKRVELVALPGIKSVKSVSMKKLKEELDKAQGTNFAPISEAVDTEPSLTHCFNDHELQYNTAPKKTANYTCDVCGKKRLSKKGAYSCQECRYNVCTVCRPVEGEAKEQSVKEEKKGNKVSPIASKSFEVCKRNHKLVYKNNPEKGTRRYHCDNCGKVFTYMANRWTCESCDYDICSICRPAECAPPLRKPKETVKSITTCPQGHSLKVVPHMYPGGKYKCDICKRIDSCKTKHWVCTSCNFDLCNNCKPVPESTTTPQPAKCSILNCPKGHTLNQSTFAYRSGNYKCDNCSAIRKCTESRWFCEPCKYDICYNCRAPSAAETKSSSTTNCSKGHSLIFSTDSYKCGKYRCDKCRTNGNCEDGRWFCKDCQYDICQNCRPRPAAATTGKSPIMRCIKGHTLNFSTHAYRGGKYICNRCRTKESCEDGRWFCKDCEYDICQHCRAPPKRPIMNCIKGHALNFSTTHLYPGGEYLCDRCRSRGNCEDGRWLCERCEYDICANCRAPPAAPSEGTTKVCDNGHQLEFSTTPYPNGSRYRCDKCQKAFLASKGRWWCDICSFDLCPKCESEKEETPIPQQPVVRHNWCNPESAHWFVIVNIGEPGDGVICNVCNSALVSAEKNCQCYTCGILYCQKCALNAGVIMQVPIFAPIFNDPFMGEGIGNEYMPLPQPEPVDPYNKEIDTPVYEGNKKRNNGARKASCCEQCNLL